MSTIEKLLVQKQAELEREARALQILLESERQARREDVARHACTVEALQRELEIARSHARGRTKS